LDFGDVVRTLAQGQIGPTGILVGCPRNEKAFAGGGLEWRGL